MNKHLSTLARQSAALACAAALTAVCPAQAFSVSTGATAVTLHPGEVAHITFTLNFDPGLELDHFGYSWSVISQESSFYFQPKLFNLWTFASEPGTGRMESTGNGMVFTWWAMDLRTYQPTAPLRPPETSELKFDVATYAGAPIGASTYLIVEFYAHDAKTNLTMDGSGGYTVTLAPVPEPAAWLSLAGGLGVLAMFARRRSQMARRGASLMARPQR